MSLITSDAAYFGIDLGNSGVRVVQLRPVSGKPVLLNYGEAYLPPGVFTSDSVIDQNTIVETISQLLKQTQISAKHVVASIPSSQAYTSLLMTPKLSEDELAKAMKLQAEHYVPMAVDQVKIDWSVVGQGKTENEMQVMLVAAPNLIINKYVNIMDKLGLELDALEINSIALTRSIAVDPNSAVLELDIGVNDTDITIVHGGMPKLIRTQAVGSNTLVRGVSTNLGLDEVQAEQFLMKFGLTQTKLEGQVLKAVKPTLDSLLAEIHKSIKFFATQNDGIKLEKIMLTGSASIIPELPVYLANASHLPVEITNPWAKVSYPAAIQEKLFSESYKYGVAVGLALRQMNA